MDSVALKDFIWLITVVFSFAGGYFALKFQTKNNQEKIDDFKHFKEFVYTELKQIDKKCDEMMKEKLARDTFVSVELYKAEMKHLNEVVAEIKVQNTKILEYVRK